MKVVKVVDFSFAERRKGVKINHQNSFFLKIHWFSDQKIDQSIIEKKKKKQRFFKQIGC